MIWNYSRFFAEDVKGNIPNYIKLANALYYYPDETRKKLQQIESNYENDKVLFEDIVKFKSNEEVEKFFFS
ncbi:hypothetical protein Z969_03925 [Clostridium novyi A str. 4570]|uniref:Uncharacterized protein n=1 Tax=Clostridium novyi A str. 4570 TaxID=1444290 RepID=A0AA88ZP57_CLONO|nr:hypothetical protein [Clostridium novyi]KGN02646.1 hypothetical protein Z969_03925 [Clostridium novyi A str. 4570]